MGLGLWVTHGSAMSLPWVHHRSTMMAYGLSMGFIVLAQGSSPMGHLWVTNGSPMGLSWVYSSCPWATHGFIMLAH